MKRLLGITLGILTAIGGFVDIGDLVANSETGARFGMRLAWVVVVGVIGICVYAEMCGRVAAVGGRPVFDLVRERLGPQVALANLGGSYLVTLLTLAAEIGGVALAIPAGDQRAPPAVGAARGVRAVDRAVAGQVRHHGTRVRPHGAGAGGVRGRPDRVGPPRGANSARRRRASARRTRRTGAPTGSSPCRCSPPPSHRTRCSSSPPVVSRRSERART